jgi:glycosyltransferase involved in cell wall biosynthesis
VEATLTKKILFLGHEASRTGAPALLLQFLRWLKTNALFEPELLLQRGGNLEAEFTAVLPTHDYAPLISRVRRVLPARLFTGCQLDRVARANLHRKFPSSTYPIVYANTIATLELARELCRVPRRCILHVHELEFAVRWFGMETALRESAQFVSTYIATSEAVRQYLVGKIGLPAERIVVVHGFPIAYLTAPDELAEHRRTVRARLGVAESTFVIGMCGTPDWRKGIDLFVQLALQLKVRLGERFKCVWVGGNPDDNQLRHDLAAAGLTGQVHIERPCADPQKFYAAFDAFALTSREDPFPITMLEAAATGVPLVAFSGAGGASELIGDDAGILVPYLDVVRMAEAVVSLEANRPTAKKLGARASAKVLAEYNLASQSAKLLAVLKQL